MSTFWAEIIDTSKLKETISAAVGGFKEMGDASKKTSSDIDSSLSQSQKAIKLLTADNKDLTSVIKANSVEIKQFKQEIKDLEKEKGKGGMAFFKADAEIKERKELIATIEEQNQTMQDSINKNNHLITSEKEVVDSLKQETKELKNKESVMVKLLGGQEKYNAMIGALPAPIKSAITGIMGMVKAAMAFIATPLGAVISAIVLAVQALSTWFKSSAEGQMAFAKASGYVTGILTQLKEVVISVGKYIYEAFTNPKKAVSDLWEAIKTNLLNRLKGIAEGFQSIGSIISSAFKGDWEGVKKGATDYANALLKVTTGIDDVIGRTTQWTDATLKNAKATSELKVAERQLAIDRKKYSIEEEKLRTKAAELFAKAQTGTSEAERSKALKEYQVIQDQISDKRVDFQKEEVRIQKELNALSTNTQEDYDILLEKEAELQRLETERITSKSRANRMLGSFARNDESGEKKILEDKLKAEQDFYKLQSDLLTDSEKLYRETELQKTKDEKENLDLRYKYIYEDLEKRKQAYRDAAVAAGDATTTQDVKLPPVFDEILGFYKEQENLEFIIIDEKDTVKAKAELDKVLSEFQTFEQKRLAIEADFEAKREAVKKGVSDPTKQAAIIAQINEVEKQAQASLQVEILKTSDAFVTLFGNLDYVKMTDLSDATDTARQTLDELVKSGKYTYEELKVLFDAIDKAENTIRTKNPFKALSDAFKNYKNDDGGKSFKELAKSAEEAFSLISQSLATVVGGLKDMGIAGNEATQQTLDGVVKLAGGIADLASGNPAKMISGAISVVSGMFDIFDKRTARANETIKKAQKQIDQYEKALNKLSRALNKAYSSDASKIIQDQEKLLKLQQQQIRNQLEAEKRKKPKDRSEEAIKSYEKQLVDIDNLLEDNKEKARDAIFGEGVSSAIDRFADAYMNAWGKGEERAKSQKDIVKQMVQNIIREILKGDFSKSMEKLRDMINNALADGVISASEEGMIDNFVNEMYEAADKKTAGLGKYLTDGGDAGRTSVAKGIAQASQDSVDENNALLTTMTSHTYRLADNSDKMLPNMIGIRSDVGEITSTLKAIKLDTAQLKDIKNSLEDIRDRGVIIKM